MNGYVITGTNRGLGNALTMEALGTGNWVFSLTRAADSYDEEKKYYNLFCDLSQSDHLMEKLKNLLAKAPCDNLSALVLINNAGVLSPIKPMTDILSSQIQYNINVNLVAPAILIGGFIKLTRNLTLSRRIINISSGASKNAYAGWATYCSTKSGLDMLTKCVALEQGDGPQSVKISSFAPGVLDTDMQIDIRRASQEDFPMRQRFLKLKQQGDLMSPSIVAKTLLNFDRRGLLVQGGIHDIREMLAENIQ